MTQEFSGKVALVTASASGIGRATARAFATQGASVIINDISAPAGEAAAADIRAAGNQAVYIGGDMSVERDVQYLIGEIKTSFGRLDFAHNNVGSMKGQPGFAEITDDEWDFTLDFSLKSTWLCMKHEIGLMLNGGGGAIVNTSSMAGLRYFAAANAAYSAAKAGVVSLTGYAAMTYAAQNIRVNCVAPGLVRTENIEKIYTPEQQDALSAYTQPIGRIIDASEIADAVIFLCSARAAMITGVTLPVAGGANVR